MFSIFVKNSKSIIIILRHFLMNQQSDQPADQLALPAPKRTRLIHKAAKHPQKTCNKKIANGFLPHHPANSPVKLKSQSQPVFSVAADDWLKVARDWHVGGSESVRGCIEDNMKELPVLGSIEELFSLSSSKKLLGEIDVNCFYRYCRMVSFVDNGYGQNILLRCDSASGVGHVGIDRQGAHFMNSLLMLSLEELQATQKRESFMEKLKENQSKYDASITRMSDISKELAFTYRTYLEKRNQLVDSFNLLSAKIPLQEEYSSQIAIESYTRLLIRKNLQHAFSRAELDPLNYFKFKQHLQSNRSDSFRHIRTADELKNFIEKRRPKRGRKLLLATACSVCLSDYHELSNPFQSCSVCGLRAHQMCFSFQNSRCGYCAYQKIERQVKQEVSWCFICRQSGLMTIKLGDHQFAHAFCLLIHGFWRLPSAQKCSDDDLCAHPARGCTSSEFFLQTKFRNLNSEIEFVNPQQNCTTSSLPGIDSTIYGSNQIHDVQMESESNPALGDIGLIRERQQIQVWENQHLPKKSVCGCCQQNLYKSCFLTCEACQQVYHAFCAFLSGFDLKISDHVWPSGLQNAISLNCCCEMQREVAWSRKYKLNYERIAFDCEETSFQIQKESLLQQDRDRFLFNY